MACQMKKILLLLLVVLLLVLNLQHCVDGTQQVPCFFIFGDSLSDNGNNNNLVTMAKANYQPYGIDFPEGPTGRFTNGRNLVDIIGQNLPLSIKIYTRYIFHNLFLFGHFEIFELKKLILIPRAIYINSHFFFPSFFLFILFYFNFYIEDIYLAKPT